MRLTVAGADYTFVVVPKFRARRVSIRAGPVTLTVTPAEAVALSDAIIDAAERLDGRTTNTPKEIR